jgi:hypothetical protein
MLNWKLVGSTFAFIAVHFPMDREIDDDLLPLEKWHWLVKLKKQHCGKKQKEGLKPLLFS